METEAQVEKASGGENGGRGEYSFFACLSHLTVDHASLQEGAPLLLLVETPPKLVRSVRVFHTFTLNKKVFRISVLIVWPPSISQDSDRFLATI